MKTVSLYNFSKTLMMYYLSILSLVLMSNLSLSAADFGWNSNAYQKNTYDETFSGVPGDEIIDIGNGVNKNNHVIIDARPNNVGAPYENTRSRSQPDPLGNRFSDDSTNNINQQYSGRKHDKNSRSWQSTTNIGNGYGNQNTVVIGNSDPSTRFSGQTNPNSGNTGGTTFVRNNGLDTYHVGYGTSNQNKISVESKPLEPDCYRTRCEDVKGTRRESGAAKTNQAIPLFLSFISLFYLTLI